MAGMVYSTVQIPEELVVKAFKAAMEVQPKLKACQLCVEANNACDWCAKLKIPVTKSTYGCKFHKSNDEAIREHIMTERARGKRVTELHSIKAAGMPENVVDMGPGVDSAMNAQPAAAPAPTADEEDLPF